MQGAWSAALRSARHQRAQHPHLILGEEGLGRCRALGAKVSSLCAGLLRAVQGDLRIPASTCSLVSPSYPHPTCNQSTFDRPLNRLDTAGGQIRIPGPPLTPAFVQASPLAVTFPPAQADPESSYPITIGPFFQRGKPTEGAPLSCPLLLSGTCVWTGAWTVQPSCSGRRASGRAGGRAGVPTSLAL